MSQGIGHKPILVAGATGAVGREVVRALLERGASIRVFVRSTERVKDLPEGVERAVGDLNSGQTVARALDGVGAAFFVPPHDEAEEQITRIFVLACERAGVRLVFSGVHADGPTRLQRLALRAVNGMMFPHYSSKMRLSECVRSSRTRPVMLLPGNYYQIDEISRDSLLGGTFPMPYKSFPRVDTRDVGDGAANALLDPAVEPGVYWMVGQASMGGEQIAANWSAALERDVRYVPDLSVSKQLFATHLSGKKATDYQKTQELIARIALATKAADLRRGEALLRRPFRSHADYARDTAARWRESAKT